MAAVPFKVEEHVSQARITAGLQDVMKVYAQHNLTGTVKQALDINGESVHVRWNITEAEPAPTTDQPLEVESINFDGNLEGSKNPLFRLHENRIPLILQPLKKLQQGFLEASTFSHDGPQNIVRAGKHSHQALNLCYYKIDKYIKYFGVLK